jgi:hypothetical protein
LVSLLAPQVVNLPALTLELFILPSAPLVLLGLPVGNVVRIISNQAACERARGTANCNPRPRMTALVANYRAKTSTKSAAGKGSRFASGKRPAVAARQRERGECGEEETIRRVHLVS